MKFNHPTVVAVAVAVVVGIGFAGLAACLLIICCGVVCLHKSVFFFCLYIQDVANSILRRC